MICILKIYNCLQIKLNINISFHFIIIKIIFTIQCIIFEIYVMISNRYCCNEVIISTFFFVNKLLLV